MNALNRAQLRAKGGGRFFTPLTNQRKGRGQWSSGNTGSRHSDTDKSPSYSLPALPAAFTVCSFSTRQGSLATCSPAWASS